MAAKSSLPGCRQPVACTGCPKRPCRQPLPVGIADWHAIPSLCSRQICAFGKPQGTVARVHIGQVVMSIHTKLHSKERVIEALCRAKFKILGYQKI